jgi:hypothetical protein
MKATKNVCVDRFSKNLFTKIKRRRFSLKSKNKYNSGNYELEMCWDILLWLLHRRVTIHRFHALWSKNVWPTDIWSTHMQNPCRPNIVITVCVPNGVCYHMCVDQMFVGQTVFDRKTWIRFKPP